VTTPLSWLYRAGVSLRNRRYDRHPDASKRLPAPVVSVGNLTVGGSGKTPLVGALARVLIGRGARVAALSRGYGRRSRAPFVLVSDGSEIRAAAEECGDEPLELARSVPGLAVAVGPDRAAVGREVLEKLGARWLLLDDGFQHRRVRRDLDLVCFDALEPVESLSLLPRGRLREPLESLARAHAVVWTRWSEGCPSEELESIVRRAAPGLPSLRATSRLLGFSRVGGSETLRADELRDRPVGVLLGVARPERILETIEARVVHSVAKRDHHFWAAAEVRSIAEEAKRKGAIALVTTGKDAVKIDFEVPALPLYSLRIETEILDRAQLEDLLAPLFQRSSFGAIL
jgi:tetraacyldisaccharide 4'-kinase